MSKFSEQDQIEAIQSYYDTEITNAELIWFLHFEKKLTKKRLKTMLKINTTVDNISSIMKDPSFLDIFPNDDEIWININRNKKNRKILRSINFPLIYKW